MGGITRRSSTFPDAATLTAIEGVFIVDEAPMGAVQGSPSGTVCFVGEYEDGGFATDPAQPADVFHPPGGAIAVPRDKWAERVGTLGYSFQGVRNQFPCARRSLGEWWNGNAYVQAKDLAFRAFYAMRVDTSVGALTFAPLAFVESGTVGPWALTSGQTLVVAIDGGATATATFTGAAATVTGAGGTFALTAGEQLTLSLDGATAVTTTFAAIDTNVDLAAARINATFGSTVATNVGGQLRLTSPTRGSSSRVQVVSATAGTLAKLGLAAGTTSGTGNVATLAAVSAAEVKAIVEKAVAGSIARLPDSGRVRIASARATSGTVKIDASSTAVAIGFPLGVAVGASSGPLPSTIPAGTVCSDGSKAARVVTMQTLKIPAGTTQAVVVRCRPATDDGTFAAVAAGAIATLESVVSPSAEWAVRNAAALSPAPTEAQKDAAYLAAIDATKALSGPPRKFNYIASARQSNAIRRQLKQNAIDTSGLGHYGRKAILAPPIGTTLDAMSAAAEPGVGAYRHERVSYVPEWRKYVPEIAALGSAVGGPGFTDDGLVEVHGDIVAASLDSLLAPEENPAQTTDKIPSSYVGVGSALASWGPDEYVRAKAAGIEAPYVDEDEGAQFMSGVTSVDPIAFPTQAPKSRVRLADFLTDSLADFDKPYVKKLKTEERAAQLLSKTQEFLQGLQDAERIGPFDVTEGSAPARGVFVLNLRIEPLDSMDEIVLRATIGAGAVVSVGGAKAV
jgi:hypothetical protein